MFTTIRHYVNKITKEVHNEEKFRYYLFNSRQTWKNHVKDLQMMKKEYENYLQMGGDEDYVNFLCLFWREHFLVVAIFSGLKIVDITFDEEGNIIHMIEIPMTEEEFLEDVCDRFCL